MDSLTLCSYYASIDRRRISPVKQHLGPFELIFDMKVFLGEVKDRNFCPFIHEPMDPRRGDPTILAWSQEHHY
jgi:hypothetical protein